MIILDKDVNAIVIPYKSTFFSVAICECVLAALLVLSAFGIKFFLPKTYKQAKKWYVENITVDINISEFIKEANNENQDIRD